MERLKRFGKAVLGEWLWALVVVLMLLKGLAFVGIIATATEEISVMTFDMALVYIGGFLIYLSYAVLLFAPSLFLKGRGRLWYIVIVDTFFSLLLMWDMWYYRGFANLISPHLLKQTANLEGMGDSILSFAHAVDLIFVVEIPLLLVLPWVMKRRFYSKSPRRIIAGVAATLFPLAYLLGLYLKFDVIGQGKEQSIFHTNWTPVQTIYKLSPLGYHFFDTGLFIQESMPTRISDKQEQEIKAFYAGKQENLPDNEFRGMFKGRNLMFIQVESLENYAINLKVEGKEVTPNLNRIANEGLHFNGVHEQVYNGTSSDSDLMTNTSMYPVRSGSTFFRFPGNTYNSMPKLMEKMGYSTIAIHPDRGSFWNWMPSLTSIGFQKCMDVTKFDVDESIGLGLSDGSYLRQLRPVFKGLKQPFYSFFVTLTSHGPFDLPQKYRELNLAPSLDISKTGGYFESLHYTDKQLGMFLDGLKQDGILDNTVLVIYGDHCGLHRYYPGDLEQFSNESWYKANDQCVPLIIWSPGVKPQVFDVNGGQVDILPTASYLMGVDPKDIANTAIGRNLLNTKMDAAILSSGRIVGNPTDAQKEQLQKGLELSDLMVRANYYNKIRNASGN